MLTTLRIRNLALVEELALELPRGYLAITGETGAGKSILIGALNLLIGERADRSLIRAGADACAVEAVFEVQSLRAPLSAFLAEQGLEPCEDGQLFLKRTITSAGGSRQFVNGSPTTVATLATLGEWLVDMHGPHDHQSLLVPARQLAILDAFARADAGPNLLAGLLRERATLQEEKRALIIDEATYARQIDLLRHQAQEIAEARLKPGEDREVEEDHQRASHAARLREQVQAALNCLDGEERSLQALAGDLGRVLQDIHRLDPAAGPLVDLQQQAASALQELHTGLERYADRVDLDPVRLRELEDRLNLLHSLKRKYGPTIEEIIGVGADARVRLEQLEQRDADLARLQAKLAAVEASLRAAARDLTARRRQAIPGLAKAVRQELEDLGFQRSHFEIQFTTDGEQPGVMPSASGWDRVEFLFAPNPGEPARPLRAIASSGEMARVMLALKTVLAAEDDVLLLVFDEVDANVGGETARVVGRKMRRIAERHQVLCITHLAPVAAEAEAQFVVTKEVRDGRSLTEVRLLAGRERTLELARMLGGQGEAARRHAEELLRTAGRS